MQIWNNSISRSVFHLVYSKKKKKCFYFITVITNECINFFKVIFIQEFFDFMLKNSSYSQPSTAFSLFFSTMLLTGKASNVLDSVACMKTKRANPLWFSFSIWCLMGNPALLLLFWVIVGVQPRLCSSDKTTSFNFIHSKWSLADTEIQT